MVRLLMIGIAALTFTTAVPAAALPQPEGGWSANTTFVIWAIGPRVSASDSSWENYSKRNSKNGVVVILIGGGGRTGKKRPAASRAWDTIPIAR
jgi:hypothetical protein